MRNIKHRVDKLSKQLKPKDDLIIRIKGFSGGSDTIQTYRKVGGKYHQISKEHES